MWDVYETRRSAEIIDFADLYLAIERDTYDRNIYVMNFHSFEKYCDRYNLELPINLCAVAHEKLQIFGRKFELLEAMPDNEVLVINTGHPNW